MTEFDEFQLLVKPDFQDPNQWSIHVQKCPRNEFKGNQGNAQLRVLPADLKVLRNPTAAPDLAALQQLGKAVLDSIMPPTLQAGLQVCLNDAQQKQRGLRLVVTMDGDARPPAGIRNLELPLEAAFNQQIDFLGINIRTPVSRGVVTELDREPVGVQVPLKMLVVASEPTGMPPVNAAAEKAAIDQALNNLINSGAVRVDFCEPPTLATLDRMVQQKRYQVVHFIGHGDFEVVSDPTPQPHLYFEKDTADRGRHAVDAQQLFNVLRNGSIPLVVMTACSTAASTPNGADYPVTAFESLAQALVKRDTGPSAVVAMQFDFETQAATVFSRALYEKLLNPEWSLDEAVASARSALVAKFGAGHRAWVNPTVYWRCKGGRLFNLKNVNGELSPEDEKKISRIEQKIEIYEEQLSDLAQKPAAEQEAVKNVRQDWQTKIQQLQKERGFILGSTVRMLGGTAEADGTVHCMLTLQLRLPATIGNVKVTVNYDPLDFDFVDHAAGKDVPLASVFPQQNAGQLNKVMVTNASQNIAWAPGEYELCKLMFRIKNPNQKPFLYIKLADADVQRNGVSEAFQTLHASVFSS